MIKPLIAKTINWTTLILGVGLLVSCGNQETRVEVGNQKQILHIGNGMEPEAIDPQIVTGVPGGRIVTALFEGLVSQHPKTLEPVPGVAKRWEISNDKTEYTFFLREDAQWSNGNPITAQDFERSYRRILMPELGAEYAYMFYDVLNAKRFNQGEITDFSKVGIKAVDEHALKITLNSPTPYFLTMLDHGSWSPVPIPTIKEHGSLTERGNPWTRPQNFVGNGPFTLEKRQINKVIKVQKSPTYWDADEVELQAVHFYPIENQETEERAFRAGQLHVTATLPPSKIEVYRNENPELIRIDPFLATTYFEVNTTIEPLDDKRVRRALALAIDRNSIVKHVTKGGQKPAYHYTPPDTAGYTAKARLEGTVEEAQKLLADAGYPDGKGFPSIEILYTAYGGTGNVAKAVQEMWRRNLNIDATLINQEWKVMLDQVHTMDYEVAALGWVGDYIDPNTFLDMWVSDGGINNTGFSNAEYDRLIAKAARTADNDERYKYFQRAEAILMDELPIIPLFFGTRVRLVRPSVKGWHPNILDDRPYKHVYLEPRAP